MQLQQNATTVSGPAASPYHTAALSYAQAGLAVFPLIPGYKHPFKGSGGFKDATTDPAIINHWWSQTPNANIGIATGTLSGGIVVIDVDSADRWGPWTDSVKSILNETNAPMVKSGRNGGGYHVYFRVQTPPKCEWLCLDPWYFDPTPQKNKPNGDWKQKAAIETRANGGYIVAPPSLHPHGQQYNPLRGDLLQIPTIDQQTLDRLFLAAYALDRAGNPPEGKKPRPLPDSLARLLGVERKQSKQQPPQTPKPQPPTFPGSSMLQPAPAPQAPPLNTTNGLIGAFNSQFPAEQVLQMLGYQFNNGRWNEPGGDSNAIVILNGRIYDHCSNHETNDGFAHDPFSFFTLVKHGGDQAAALADARQMLGESGQPQTNQQPQPLPAIPYPSPLSPAAYHGLAGQIVQAIEPHTEADPAALLVQFLTAFGSIVGPKPHFIADGSRHGTNLFSVMVGNTAKGRKGTSWANVKHPLAFVADDWLNTCTAEGLSSGEGLIWRVRDPIQKRVPIKQKGRRTGEYETVEEDPGIPDKRLLVQEGEFAQVLKVLAREGNTLSAIIRRAWDGGSKLESLTKSSPATATNPHISIIAHVTEQEVNRLLGETESGNGFANRFLWVCVQRSKCLPEGGQLASVNFTDMAERLNNAITFASQTGLLTKDDQAKQLWAQVYPDLSEGKPGPVGGIIARAEAQVMRLAMLYALLDQTNVIGLLHLQAALAVWRHCEDSAKYIFSQNKGEADPLAKLLDWINKQDRPISARDIARGPYQRQANATAKAEADLRQLVEAGHGVMADIRNPNGGPPAHCFCTPAVQARLRPAA